VLSSIRFLDPETGLDASSGLVLDVGLDDSAEPLEVLFEAGLEDPADSLNEVLEDGNTGSAESLHDDPLEEGLEVSVDSRPIRVDEIGKYLSNLAISGFMIQPNTSCEGCRSSRVSPDAAGILTERDCCSLA
jgi:hypothetical protein